MPYSLGVITFTSQYACCGGKQKVRHHVGIVVFLETQTPQNEKQGKCPSGVVCQCFGGFRGCYDSLKSSLALWMAASDTLLPLSICAISLIRSSASSITMLLLTPVGVSVLVTL